MEENYQSKIINIAVTLINFNIKEFTDNIVLQVRRNIKFPHQLYVLDNGSEVNQVSSYTTHRIEKNIGLNGALEYLWGLLKKEDKFDAYWFLFNDIVLDEGRDYLREMADLFTELSKKYRVACIVPSYHFEGKEKVVPPFMKKRIGGTFRPIVWIEWNACLVSREFMNKFFPHGFGLKTKHAFQDVVTNFIGWKSGYGSFVMDNLSISHLENQTFLKHGGRAVNGVFVPDIVGLNEMLVADMKIVIDDFKKKGINFLKERERLHNDIDRRGDFEKYLIPGINKESLFKKTKNVLQDLSYDVGEKLKYIRSLICKRR